MRYYYFVSYVFSSDTRNGSGRTFIDTDKPLNSQERIEKAEKGIRESDSEYKQLAIMNFKLLRKKKEK